MPFIADLHIHSRFSRATGKGLNVFLLAAWAAVKGISVLGTGDFTHPAWRTELRDALRPDESSGLYRLKDPSQASGLLPQFSTLLHPAKTPLFMLQAEISSIYKRDGRVRKVHNLVYMPDFDAAERFCRRLEQAGNLASDGRPILGLDSRHILEIALAADSRAVLIPAHIWTPWFSIFGSKSGFDSLEECFGDLSREIFALETGLSSDPAMNRLWSALDRFRMVSNSDAHSAENLGREANLFTGPPSYDGIFAALRDKDGPCAYAGTLEFFPEEGKYHLDGHRECKQVLTPQESRELNDICPVCGKPLTVGVLHRVLELADRTEPAQIDEPAFVSLIPLPEILSELLGVGPKSRKVAERYAALVERFGPELHILHETEIADLRAHWDLLGEAVERMRDGRVIRQGGYDGEYGVVRVFDEKERRAFAGGVRRASLPGVNASGRDSRETLPPTEKRGEEKIYRRAELDMSKTAALSLPEFSEEQIAAMEAGPHPVLVLAGPGAGKTRILVGRLLALLERGVPAQRIVALTFTRRAASELEERLRTALKTKATQTRLPTADTLHALAYSMWHKLSTQPPMLLSEEAALRLFRSANADLSAQRMKDAWERLSLARERLEPCPEDILSVAGRYADAKADYGLADYTDLLEFWLTRLREGVTAPWGYVLVDEAQDLSPLQLALIQALLPLDGQGFFGIGDPDQSIYAFRGALPDLPGTLQKEWSGLVVYQLGNGYRSMPGIVQAINMLLDGQGACGPLRAARQGAAAMRIFSAPGDKAEARWIAERIRALLGATSHTLSDRNLGDAENLRSSGDPDRVYSPGDIAILVRIKALIPLYKTMLEQFHIPCSAPEQEAFWRDPRVALLLAGAERFLGLADVGGQAVEELVCPPETWARGPAAVATALRCRPPFDPFFEQSAALCSLEKLWIAAGSWKDLFTQLHFMRDIEQVRERAEQVRLLTLHAAKGLEFKAIFMPALEQGLLPFERPGAGGASEIERARIAQEELRLFYVGISRAGDALFLSHAAQRRLYGRICALPCSPFLERVRELFKASTLMVHSRVTGQQLKLV